MCILTYHHILDDEDIEVGVLATQQDEDIDAGIAREGSTQSPVAESSAIDDKILSAIESVLINAGPDGFAAGYVAVSLNPVTMGSGLNFSS